MMKLKQSNPFAAITVLIMIAALFIGMYVMMKPFAQIYDRFTDDTDYIARYTTQDSCEDHGYWVDGECHQVPNEAKSVMVRMRYAWLVAPFILAIGLFLWYLVVISRRDPRYLG